MDKKTILIFGVGPLQESLIKRCKEKGLYTVGIDPNSNAECKGIVDYFEVVSGDNFDSTIAIARKYNISGIITAATDKPLVMMARVAEALNLSFFSVETARISTDKFIMKKKFIEFGLLCAKGFLINNAEDLYDLDISYPVIVKPRDNSGSRGVIYCESYDSAVSAVKEALQYTKKGNVLVEEFIEGREYSIEGIHYNGEHHAIQFTEKTTTDFPYNVEIAHVQPADISIQQQEDIRLLISRIGQILGFNNCASHTEIKINTHGIYIIETSPRLGGDFISSTLVPLSTGINMEEALIDISIQSNEFRIDFNNFCSRYSGVMFFQLPEGILNRIGKIENIKNINGFQSYRFDLEVGEIIPPIENSACRYGYSIFQTDGLDELYKSITLCKKIISNEISIEKHGK